jgi:hypothetical protein
MSTKTSEKTEAQKRALAKREAKRKADEEEEKLKQEAYGDTDALQLATEVCQENERLLTQVKILEQGDTKAELAKQIRLRQQSEDEKGRLMEQLATANKELRKFGRYFEDLRKVTGAKTNAGAVEAVKVAFQQAA